MLDFLYNNSLDMTIIKEKGYIKNDKFTDSFINAYSMYYYILLEYVDRVLNLRSLDMQLSRLEEPIIKKEKNDEHSLSYMNYIYIDNILHIERLENNIIDLLSNMYISKKYKVDKKMVEFVKKTYKSVLIDNGEINLRINVVYDFDIQKNKYNNYNDLIRKTDNEVLLLISKFDKNKKYLDISCEINNLGYDEELKLKLKNMFNK